MAMIGTYHLCVYSLSYCYTLWTLSCFYSNFTRLCEDFMAHLHGLVQTRLTQNKELPELSAIDTLIESVGFSAEQFQNQIGELENSYHSNTKQFI